MVGYEVQNKNLENRKILLFRKNNLLKPIDKKGEKA